MMSWLKQAEDEFMTKLRRRIHQELPLVDDADVQQLAFVLIRSNVRLDNRFYDWLDQKTGSVKASRHFLRCFAPTWEERYRAGHACKIH